MGKLSCLKRGVVKYEKRREIIAAIEKGILKESKKSKKEEIAGLDGELLQNSKGHN